MPPERIEYDCEGRRLGSGKTRASEDGRFTDDLSKQDLEQWVTHVDYSRQLFDASLI
jgi:hypothetical protein